MDFRDIFDQDQIIWLGETTLTRGSID